MFLYIVALVVVFARRALKAGTVPPNERTIWVLILCIGNAIAMSIYWWLFVWNDGRAEAGQAPAAGSAAGPWNA